MVRAIVSRQVRRGSIWIPLHFGEARANLLTTDAGDPVTQTASYKVCAADVAKVEDATSDNVFPGCHYAVDGPGGHHG